MADSTSQPASGNYGWAHSLERRLPLAIAALLVFVVVIFGILTFNELITTSREAAESQLTSLMKVARNNSEGIMGRRAATLVRTAGDTSLHRAFQTADANLLADQPRRTPITEITTPRTQEIPLDAPPGTPRGIRGLGLTVQLRDADGALTNLRPDSVHTSPEDEEALRKLIASVHPGDSLATGPLYSVNRQARYWVVAPMRSGETIIGYLADRRVLIPTNANAGTADSTARARGGPGARTDSVAGRGGRGGRAPDVESTLRDISGQPIRVYYANAVGDVWTDPTGSVIDPPFRMPQGDTIRLTRDDGEKVVGIKASVAGTPWVLLFVIRESAITARSLAFARRLVPITLVILLLGVGAAWGISRRVTEPLKTLTDAADDIARGNYDRRVTIETNGELSQLANAFNSMAKRVGESHHELARRMHESMSLTGELEIANLELREAQQAAVLARNLSEEARLEAQRASEAKTSFLAMMSHELRTPLSAIAGYTEILQIGLRGPLNETQLSDLERIRSNQAHLLTIINDMLDLSQIESGQLAVECEAVSLDEIFDQVDPIVTPLIQQRKISCDVDPELRSIWVHADRERTRQVMVNLISNAARFSEVGGRIAIRGTTKNGRVFIQVVDSGIGIPESKLEAIFEPFVQVDSGPTRRTGGTGLGLPISRRLAEAMSGTLTVESTLGEGSIFTLELPYAEPVSRPRRMPQMETQTARAR